MARPLPKCHFRIFQEDYVLHSDVSENYVADDNNSVPSGCESVFSQGPSGSVAGGGGGEHVLVLAFQFVNVRRFI